MEYEEFFKGLCSKIVLGLLSVDAPERVIRSTASLNGRTPLADFPVSSEE